MHVALFVCWWRLTLTVRSIPHGTQTVPGHSRSGVAPAEGSSSLRDTIPREIVVRCQQLVTGTANLLLWSQQLIIERKRKSRSRDVNGLNFTLGNELGLPDARYRFVRTPSLCEYQRQQADVKLPSVSTRAPGEVVAPIGGGRRGARRERGWKLVFSSRQKTISSLASGRVNRLEDTRAFLHPIVYTHSPRSALAAETTAGQLIVHAPNADDQQGADAR